MKLSFKLLALLLTLCISLSLFISCDVPSDNPDGNGAGEFVDYVSALKLDMNTESLKINATVKSYIDGDTTHFYVDRSVCEDGVLKARYLAINTPESTGKVEPWGKAASKFTRSKLEGAVSIILESDDGKWNIDSTGERHLVWVWYKTTEDAEYRNLNLEILQNGYAVASNSAANRYGETCVSAIDQALRHELYVYSDELDPNFPYGDAQEITLKELRTHIEEYDGALVAFNGVVVMNSDGSIIVEEYDAENNMYYGMTIYYANSGLNAAGMKILTAGNEIRVVGVVSYWETGGVYQVSSLEYNARDKENPRNIKLLSDGHSVGYFEVDAKTFTSQINVMIGDEEKTFDYAALILNTSVSMKNLTVNSVYTTPDGDSAGAMTLHCTASDGTKIDIRTIVLRDANGVKITASYFEGKTIDVKGFVDYFDGDYQIELYSVKDVTIHN